MKYMLGSVFFVGIFLICACGRLGPLQSAEKSFLKNSTLSFLSLLQGHKYYHLFITTTTRTENMKFSITTVAFHGCCYLGLCPILLHPDGPGCSPLGRVILNVHMHEVQGGGCWRWSVRCLRSGYLCPGEEY